MYPGQRQRCSAWEVHLPKAPFAILWPAAFLQRTAKRNTPLCVAPLLDASRSGSSDMCSRGQPALPSASSLGEESVLLMHHWVERVHLKSFSSKEYFFYKDRISPILISFFSTKTRNITFKRTSVPSSDVSFSTGIYEINSS